MLHELSSLLDALERMLDPAGQDALRARHACALRGEAVARLPLVISYPLPAEVRPRPFPFREAFHDPERMLFNELTQAFGSSIALHGVVGDDLPYTVRANGGTGVVASMFGAAIELVDDNPPWVRPVAGDDAVRRILDIDPADLSAGLCPRVFDIYSRYREILERYPVLRRCLAVVLPDLQGPFDTAELLLGSGIYSDFYERPDVVQAVLARVAAAQAAVARRLREQGFVREPLPGFSHQHGFVIPGAILIRNDSAINISAAMYAAAVAPHDAFVLRELGGGGIHFCGRGEHLVPALLDVPGLTCIDLGQSRLNDVDSIYRQARARGVPLTRVEVTEAELLSPALPERWPTGVSLCLQAPSCADAGRLARRWKAVER